jgi:ubiquinone/menaquinone biosynthesis C-methylase UbiE
MNPAEFQNIAGAERDMWWFAGMRRILDAWVSRLQKHQFENVLEGGCGTGYMSRWLAGRYGWRMFPVDLDFGGLSYGRREGIARMAQCDIARIPYREATFDAVVSLDVLVHFPRGMEAVALQEFARVLKPGGKLILRVSALDVLRSRHSIFAHERQRFTRNRIGAAVAGAGFRVLETSYANSLLMPVALFKFRVWEPLTATEPKSGVVVPGAFLNQALEWPLKLEAWLLRRGWNLPLGQSILVLAEREY